MTIFEKREWRKRRAVFFTREFRRRELKKARILRKMQKCWKQALQRVAKLDKQYEAVGRRYL